MTATTQSIQALSAVEWELIIVGAGTAGMPCAIEAAKSGLKRILVIEKSQNVGGTLHWTVAHMSAGGTQLQKARGIEDSPEEHYNDIMRISACSANPELTRLATEEAPSTIAWLQSLGFPFDACCPTLVYGHAPYTRARTYFANVQRGGIVLLSLLLPEWERYIRCGAITLLLGCTLTDILACDGCVYGVKVHDGSAVQEHYARHVVLATGGYAANPSFFARVTPYAPPLYSAANPTSQGEGIEAALRIGAQFHGAEKHNVSLGGIELIPNSQRVDIWSAWAMVSTSAYRTTRELYVNEEGKRFLNEDEVNADIRERAVMRQPRWQFWVLFDEYALHQSYAEHQPLVRQWITVAMVKQHAALGTYLRCAESIEKLAAMCGIHVRHCVETVQRFNTNIHGIPDEFGRTTFPAPLHQAPFYALRINACALISFGGLAVNTRFQVLDIKNKPIQGLYAIGEILGAAATSGHAFCSGMLVTPALSFGRMLGKQMQENIACTIPRRRSVQIPTLSLRA